jgi:outer membrane protein OmpA-like peptidoglycan-associated protein
MAPVRPMLGDLELQQAQQIEVDQDGDFAVHEVPALEGDFDQPLGRRGAAVTLSGVLTGAGVADGLKSLRERFRSAEPVPFAADIATATKLDKVLIEEMGVRELAGRPQRFEYAFRLREFTPPPPPETTPPPTPPPEPPDVDTATLEVEVVVEGRPDFDFSKVTVTVDGTQSDGTALSRTLTNRTGNVWREEGLPPGQYTARAVVTDPETMSGSANATLRAGQLTRVQIVLRPGALIATAFVVHFRFDKSFVEPCMRPVLRDVMKRAAEHAEEKVLVVGHTDKSGSDRYNQSLSERRARSVLAYLTSGRDPAAARAEWSELRRPAAGELPTLHDTWGPHQYQYMLQDLGFYQGNVDGRHGPQTDDAVSNFRSAKGLPPGTTVDDAVWDALIDAYLAVDQAQMTLSEDRLLPNAKNGCDGGPLKWVGCGEENPLPLPQPTRGDAFRPYRRVEVLFVRTEHLPCEPPKPDTFDKPAPGAVGQSWCLGPDSGSNHCCFATRECEKAQPGQWCVVPADPAKAQISGSFTFDDGSPAPNIRFVLISPDGEYLPDERESAPDRGDGVVARAAADGTFSFSDPKPVGIVTIEAREQFVARLRGQDRSTAKGNVVCARLDASGGSIDVVLSPVGPQAPPVNPAIALGAPAVVVRKPNTNPARVAVTLGTSGPFAGQGTLTRSSAAVHLFTAATGGTEITFDGTDNLFQGARLAAGVQLFAEGATASRAPDDVVLTLTLTGGASPVGPPAVATMTSVELTLDVCVSRTTPVADPPPLSAADKFAVGRFVQMRDPQNTHERALLLVRPPNPGGFTADLSLSVRGAASVALFADEVPAAGQAPQPFPITVPAATIPPGGARFFVEGTTVSTGPRNTGVRLGLAGGEPDGDNIAATVVQVELTGQPTVAAPPLTFARFGIWDNAYDAGGNLRNDVAEAANLAGADRRKLHFRIRDAVAAAEARIDWRTLRADRVTDDDAPPSQALSLPETAPGSHVFASRGVLLVTDDTDRDVAVNSGLAPPHPDAGVRARGTSNHRLRRARIDGFLRGEYSPQAGVRLPIVRPVFNRDPDERRRVSVRVVRYANAADPTFRVAPDATVAGQFEHANLRWNQIGIQIDAGATDDRQIPAGALNATGKFPFVHPNGAEEVAVLRDLLPLTPDDTLTVVFVDLTGANAYAAILQTNPIPVVGNPPLTMGDRFFIFIQSVLPLTEETLAHELHHVLFNRLDTPTDRQFYTLNTRPPSSFGVAPLPDARIYRRIQNRNSPDPDNDPTNTNIINWARRVRTARFPLPAGFAAATATTGNHFLGPF